MGFLDNSSVTVDAILTKRGREILAAGGDLNITKFALSDEEIDYTLWDVTHPNGTDSYGAVIENMSLLEATPNRKDFRSFLIDASQAGQTLSIDNTHYSAVDTGTVISITPTNSAITEQFIFRIDNLNIISHTSSTSDVYTGGTAQIKAGSIIDAATATVTIKGVTSGLVQVVTINVKADAGSTVDPLGPKLPDGAPANLFTGGAGAGTTYP